ncbi:MAG: tetratricopeptide repeat protein [Candidatus Omnitrophota bacterium]
MLKKAAVLSLLALFIACFFAGSAESSSKQAAYEYNEKGLKKLAAKDYDGAIADLKTARMYDPSNDNIRKNLAVAYNNYGFYLMKSDRLPFAAEKFEAALYYDDNNPYTLYNLGQVYYRLQNIAKAKEYLGKAYELKPSIRGLKDLYAKVNNEIKAEESFEKLETMHFIIAYAGQMAQDKFSYIRTYLEEAYGRVGMLLEHYPKNKTVAILYSEDSYNGLLHNKPHWTMAIFDGKVRIPVNKFKYSNQDVIAIIYHEYAHVLVSELAKGKCPLWLNEGIASKAEEYAVAKDKETIRRYFDKFGIVPFRKIPGNFMNIKDANIVKLLYMESYLLVDFISHRGGNTALRTILDYLGRGVPVDKALCLVMQSSLDDFERDWRGYIMEKYGFGQLRVR